MNNAADELTWFERLRTAAPSTAKFRRLTVAVASCLTLAASGVAAADPAGADTGSSGSTTCPTTPPVLPEGAADPGSKLNLQVAQTITPSDTGTSIVIDPAESQIRCGTTPLRSYTDLVYASPVTAGTQRSLALDLQVPAVGGPAPLVVYLPGGGFQIADKRGNLDQRTYLAEHGFAVATIEYRTIADGAIYTDSIADARSAIDYLSAHAVEYGIDPGRVAVWGQSAGGYLSAMTGLDQGSPVRAVIDEFGASDLSKIAADFDPAMQQVNHAPGNFLAQYVFGPGTTAAITDNPALVQAADPAARVDATSPAFLLLHGSDDHLISPSQTLLLHNALRAAGADSTRYVLQGADHGDLSALSGNPNGARLWSTEKVMNLIVDFLRSRLGG